MRDPSEFERTTSHMAGAAWQSDAPSSDEASEQDGPIPESIGRYQVTRLLGRGGFGRVYLAEDDQLKRAVAIKVPHARLVAKSQDAGAYITEAQTVASLDHPNIVPVYDVGSTPEYPCYIVSKYIEGASLARQFRETYDSYAKVADLLATVALALHHAHNRGLVHRDVKPGNILIDRSGKPYVVDFGLALREAEVGTGPRYAGTPAYMSPEQARGEGHRVDGRSDIFSLGVVLYQLLVGERPFRAESKALLLGQIISFEPRPPRQCDSRIPHELERICLHAMAKRSAERYPSAKDMADDLISFLNRLDQQSSASVSSHRESSQESTSAPLTIMSSASSTRSFAGDSSRVSECKVVPKGLRSFDEADAEFFLRLLPGPRDQDDLPDSIRFWRTQIQRTDNDGSFPVGLLYGPSGCGKSSLIRAGLLPRLSRYVTTVYVESAPADTEKRLRRKLHVRFPGLVQTSNLKEMVAALRQGQCISEGSKVLIVLDQFEQWLHARSESDNQELLQALRQCDGERVQCILLVRDDFWLAASRFMRELEVPLLEGRNLALVDLFETSHARKVLCDFGRAFGRLPENDSEITKQQTEFLKKSVNELAEQGRINCARLALFAEMMKTKPWTATTLKRVGGTTGIGVTFLEETFSSPSASPEHRYHQRAARAVLKALLPETGSHIKGHLRAHTELLHASGYAHRPDEFDNLIRILDSEVRLITPTDPEGIDPDDATRPTEPGQRYYQLTHDYLVQSVRDWLSRKQRETRRGRAEALLAERANWWSAKPISRHLPSLWEFLRIRLLTRKRDWTPDQKEMMGVAARLHRLRTCAWAVVIIASTLVLRDQYARFQSHTLIKHLFADAWSDIPQTIDNLRPYRRWVNPLLARTDTDDPERRLRVNLAMLPVDPSQVDPLFEQMLEGPSAAFLIIRDHLFKEADVDSLTRRLWGLVQDEESSTSVRLRSACALATYAPRDPRWREVGVQTAHQLVATSRLHSGPWIDSLEPVSSFLVEPLINIIRHEDRGPVERATATTIFGEYAADDESLIEKLASFIHETIPEDVASERRILWHRRRANTAVSLLLLNRYDQARPALRHSSDPTTRTALIHGIATSGVSPEILLPALRDEPDDSIRVALLHVLGQLSTSVFGPLERKSFLPTIRDVYLVDPNPGVRQSAKWLAGRWGETDLLVESPKPNPAAELTERQRWYVNSLGQVMVVVPVGQEFRYTERMEDKSVTTRMVRVPYEFAASETEVTVAHYRVFLDENPQGVDVHRPSYGSSDDCPVNSVTWFQAAAFCNWLSEREGIEQSQWCYLPNEHGRYEFGMRIADNYRQLAGYRLPTVVEFERAALAGATTDYFFGDDPELLRHYAWCSVNSGGTTQGVFGRMPNAFGLFGTSANIWEWCQPVGPREDPSDVSHHRIAGGTFDSTPDYLRSGLRSEFSPDEPSVFIGFRVFRTIKDR